MSEPDRKKLTISLAPADLALIGELKELTGAYSMSEVVRDALRLAAAIAREKFKK
jgi:Arc/MetJ-type ribon-helix-helix transcriptional regulator